MNQQQSEMINGYQHQEYDSEELYGKSDDLNMIGEEQFSSINTNSNNEYMPQFLHNQIAHEPSQNMQDFMRNNEVYEQNQYLTQYNYNDEYTNNNNNANNQNGNNQNNGNDINNNVKNNSYYNGGNGNNYQNSTNDSYQNNYSQGNQNNNNCSTYASSNSEYMSSDYYNQSLSESSHSNYQSTSFKTSASVPSANQPSNSSSTNNQSNRPYNNNQQSQQIRNQSAALGNSAHTNYQSSPEHFSENSTHGNTPLRVPDYSNNNSNGMGGEDDDDDDEDDMQKSENKDAGNAGSQKVKKNISKKRYEPLYDNNQVFIYEDDPVEYKKARKRVQNRQSARKVRNIKKNQTENLELNVDQLKQENQELKVLVANLSGENKRLTKEVEFFRKVFREKQTTHPNNGSSHQENNENNKNQYDQQTNNQQNSQQQSQQQSIAFQNTKYPLNGNSQNGNGIEGPLPYTMIRTGNRQGTTHNQQLVLFVVVSCLLVMTYTSTSYDNQISTHVGAFFSIDEMRTIAKTVELETKVKQIVQETMFQDTWRIVGWTLIIVAYLLYASYTLYSNFIKKVQITKDKQKVV